MREALHSSKQVCNTAYKKKKKRHIEQATRRSEWNLKASPPRIKRAQKPDLNCSKKKKARPCFACCTFILNVHY